MHGNAMSWQRAGKFNGWVSLFDKEEVACPFGEFLEEPEFGGLLQVSERQEGAPFSGESQAWSSEQCVVCLHPVWRHLYSLGGDSESFDRRPHLQL